MERALEALAVNAILAAGLAALVAVVSLRLRHPPIVHALWVVVLVKFLAPAVVPIGSILPASLVERAEELFRDEPPAVVRAGPAARSLPPGLAPGPRAAPPAHDFAPGPGGTGSPRDAASRPRAETPAAGAPLSIPPATALIALQLAGTAGVLGLALRRGRRFRRALRAGRPADEALRRRVETLAARLRVTPAPAVIRLDAAISPLVWWGGGRPRLVLPTDLLPALEPAELDAVLAHELAHLRRRDHWVRLLELAVTAVFWWHPIAWWARRRLRVAEELACDDLVLRALPHRPRAYADGLLKTLDFLSRPSPPVPALATGIGATRNLEERLVMIMKARTFSRPTPLVRGLLLGAAVAVILVSPARLLGKMATTEAPVPPREPVEPMTLALPPGVPTAPTPVPALRYAADLAEAARLAAVPAARTVRTAPDEEIEALLALRETQLDLEDKLRQLSLERQRLEQQIDEAQSARALAELREVLAQAERNGQEEGVDDLRLRLEELERTTGLEARRCQLELEVQESQAALQSEMEHRTLRYERLMAEGKTDEAEELEAQLRRAEFELQEMETKTMERELELQLEELEARRAHQRARDEFFDSKESRDED